MYFINIPHRRNFLIIPIDADKSFLMNIYTTSLSSWTEELFSKQHTQLCDITFKTH